MKEQNYTKKMLLLLLPMVLSLTLPLLMLDAPVWVMTIVGLIILSPWIFDSQVMTMIVPFAYYIIKPALYIWALVITILGVQDFFTIAFYILMAIQIPGMIKKFIGAFQLSQLR